LALTYPLESNKPCASLALGPAQPLPPYGLTSLLEMLRFYADKFVAALNALSTIESVLLSDPKSFSGNQSNFDYLVGHLDFMIEHLAALQLPVTSKKAEALRAMAKGRLHYADNEGLCMLMRRSSEDLRERFEHELESKLVYCISSRADLFDDAKPLFGDDVERSFPSASLDISEAGKCLGLRRSTASVMHLMRVTETGLNCLAAAINVSFAHTNWQNVLDQVEKKANAISAASHGANWREEQQFYSEAAVHLRLIKNAWRNHSMHAQAVYTEEKAEEIFNSVKSFMQHLATRLSEPVSVSQNAV
jgi:hypothetical protein